MTENVLYFYKEKLHSVIQLLYHSCKWSYHFHFFMHLIWIRSLQCVFATSKTWNHTAHKLHFWPWRQPAGGILIPAFGTNSVRQAFWMLFMLWIELHSLSKQWQQPVVIGKARENLQQNIECQYLWAYWFMLPKNFPLFLSFLTAVWHTH